MSARNYYVRNSNQDILNSLADDYRSMGRDVKVEGDCLTVFALKQKPVPVKKKKFERKPRPSRNPLDNIPEAPVVSRDDKGQAPKRRE